MYGSGAVIGSATIAALHRTILKDLIVALTAFAVGVVGAALPGAVIALAAKSAALATAIASLGSACASPSDNSLFLSHLIARYKQAECSMNKKWL